MNQIIEANESIKNKNIEKEKRDNEKAMIEEN